MFSRRAAIGAFAGLTMLTTAIAAPLMTMVEDYETIPPKHSDVEAQLRSSTTQLGKAIEVALAAHEGSVAESASFGTDADGRAVVNITMYHDGEKAVVSVNPADGAVMDSKKISRFPGEAVSGDWVETDSGLKYYDIVKGTGPTPPNASTTVKVHYSGWLVDGTMFDSSVQRGQPIDFPLNRVIAGWTEGVGSMKVGGKRKLIIPFDLAYGPRGRGPTIPPRATLIFDVELLDIVN